MGQERKTKGNSTIQIKQATEEITLDGNLREPSWRNADVADNFWMCFPVDDRAVSPEIQTEVRVTYDEQYIYIGAVCHGDNNYIIPTLKRDNREFWTGDVFGLVIDPVNESTNGFAFAVNPAGVQVDALVSGRTGTRAELDRGQSSGGFNTAWDNQWFVEVKPEIDRWFVEMAIPFKTLRFDPNKTSWGINFTRGEPRSNSWHSWSPVPVQFMTIDLGYTGTLQWDNAPGKTKSNVSMIPYSLASISRDFEEGTDTEVNFRAGGDAKIAVTSSLNLDLTFNPDFSQVEVDEQVTNLTTFNIRFPEKRLFFLENSDLFSDFGITPMRPFFSRRIGLDDDGNTIPILYGARLSGNLNESMRIGLMNMHTKEGDEYPTQNYTSVSFHQQVLDRSVVKGYFHNRQAINAIDFDVADYNRTAGLEFSYFSQDARWRAFSGYGLSFTEGLTGKNYFYNIGGGFDGKKVSFYTNLSGIGNNYYADMGWIPFADHYDAVRDTSFHVGFQHLFSRFGYTFYPADQSKVVSHQLNIRHILDVNNDLELLQNQLEFIYFVKFSNTAQLTIEYAHEDQELLFPFDFTDEEPLAADRYHFDYVQVGYQNDWRNFFGWWSQALYGTFYNGTRFEISLGGRYRVQPWGNFGLNFVYNRLVFPDPYGSENLLLIGPRIEFNFSKDLFWTTFLQYNTQANNVNINSRLQWRFAPMSDFFLVYQDNYRIEGMFGPKDRAVVAKLSYWFSL